jgi:uncharacterized protein (DUF488 family)
VPEGTRTIYTIGHSNHDLQGFLDLLRRHRIEVLVDVRSQPYSAYATQFASAPLKEALGHAGIRYLFLGRELGGRPDDPGCYDPDGRVDYGRVAATPLFQEGIARLQRGIVQYRIALLCAEENPAGCHRRRLVGRVLGEAGVEVLHIRGSGELEHEDAIAARERGAGDQLSLFGAAGQPEAWKSLQPVPQRGSSGRGRARGAANAEA